MQGGYASLGHVVLQQHGGGHHVFASRHAAESAGNLKRACNARLGAGLGVQAGNVASIEFDAACTWRKVPGHTIEERGFTSPVGTNQTNNLSRIDAK